MAPIPATFCGTPQDLAAMMIRRTRIMSATGVSFIFVGDVEPSSNVGPWLRGGTQWWVFDSDLKRYVPLDISASEKTWYFIGATQPTATEPPVWLRTTKDPSEADPSPGQPISWYVFTGSVWQPYNNIVFSGPTTTRPGDPVDLQMYYDTDIQTLIWFERSIWRTVSGVVGDVKFVIFPTIEEALLRNPGWERVAGTAFQGRYISAATANSDGSSPVTTNPGVATHNALSIYGEADQLLVGPSALTYPPTVALWALVKG